MAAKRTQTSCHVSRGGVDSKISKPKMIDQSTDSPTKKVKGVDMNVTPKSHEIPHGLEGAMSEANRSLNMLFSEFTELLRERVSVDSSQVNELDDILMEARSLESHLKEKKEHLRHSLAVISEKLQG
ncbi:hypothetical protein AALO_G00208020 [Alosa alosa]|uniref:Testis-expressed protein 12 n=1 Tax=Alosa alosa TaxID=278164 RepID=A0AAV6G2E0_9TELE|nr:hypothetical protein AALO_G00208020 [Alosa alosa]